MQPKTLIDKVDAFEMYYALGATRSLTKLHEAIHRHTPECTPGPDTLKRWSTRFKWQNKIVIRDNATYDGVAEKMTEAMVDTKVKELEQLDQAMREIDAVMPLIFDALQSCTIKDPKTGKKHVKIVPENTNDMANLYRAQTGFVNAKIKLIETVRKIMGESDNVNLKTVLEVRYEDLPKDD